MADGPETHATKQLPKISELEILLANVENRIKNEVRSLAAGIETKQDANHGIVMHEIGLVKTRVDEIERWKTDSSQKLDDHSIRAKELTSQTKKLSASDLKAESDLAQAKIDLEARVKAETEAREALAVKVDTLAVNVDTIVTGYCPGKIAITSNWPGCIFGQSDNR